MDNRDKIEISSFLKDSDLRTKAESAAIEVYETLSDSVKNKLDTFCMQENLDSKGLEQIITYFYDSLSDLRIELPQPLIPEDGPANTQERMLSMVASRIAGKREEDPGDPLAHAAAVAFSGFFGTFMGASMLRGFMHTMEGTVPKGILPYMNEERVKIVAHLACAILFASYIVYHHYSMKKKEFEKRELEKSLREVKGLLKETPTANKPGALQGPYQPPKNLPKNVRRNPQR
jgi:hypothetical protein